MLKLLTVALVMLIGGQALAGKWPATGYQHFNDIRSLAKGCPAGTRVAFTLNDGSQMFGELLRYEGATDYIWYQPDGTGHSWFAQDALSVHELWRLDLAPKI